MRVNLPNGGRKQKSDSRRAKMESGRGRSSTLIDSGDGFSVSYRRVHFLMTPLHDPLMIPL